MGAAAGVEIGTRSAIALVDGPGQPTLVGSRVRDVAVKRESDGSLAASGVVGSAAAGFAGQLGQPEPIVVDGTPYAVEALLAIVIAAGLADVGGAPLVGIAHADGLDDHRRGLLVASARQAGIPDHAVELVTAAEALQALAASGLQVAQDLAVATGAALVALQRRSATAGGASAGGLGPAVAGAAGGAGAVGAGAAGGAGAAAMMGSSGEVGAAAAGGPAGTVPHLGDASAALNAPPAGTAGVPHLGDASAALNAPPAGTAGVPHLGDASAGVSNISETMGAGASGQPVTTAGVPHLGDASAGVSNLSETMAAGGAGAQGGTAGSSLAGAGAAGITGLKLGILAAVVATMVAAVGIGYAVTRGDDEEARTAATTVAPPPATTAPAVQSPQSSVVVTAAPVITAAPATTEAPVATEASVVVAETPAGECIVGTWIMDNAAYSQLATAAVAAEGGTVGVTMGQIVVDFQPDGTYQVDPNGFSVALTLPEGAAHMMWSGGDSGVWTANADGTFTFEPTSVGTTIAIDVTVDGGTFSIPVPSEGGTLQGSHVAECSADVLTLITNTGDVGHIPLNRS